MRLIDRTGLIIARDRGDSIWSFEISFQMFAFYLGSVKHEDDEGMYLPKFMKCQNSRERSWRAITKFVWQLGRYEPSSPVSYTAPLLPYFLCYHPTFLQNFFNWLTSTVYWLTFAPFYERVRPIFLPDNNQRRLFTGGVGGDLPPFNVTNIYDSTFSPEGILIQLTQNFFNFFSNTLFWLSFIPVYERIGPIFNVDEWVYPSIYLFWVRIFHKAFDLRV